MSKKRLKIFYLIIISFLFVFLCLFSIPSNKKEKRSLNIDKKLKFSEKVGEHIRKEIQSSRSSENAEKSLNDRSTQVSSNSSVQKNRGNAKQSPSEESATLIESQRNKTDKTSQSSAKDQNKEQATSNFSSSKSNSTEKTYLVTRVIDGDTIVLENGERVRYIGIDTPEISQNECFALEAKKKNEELVLGKSI